MDVRAPVGQYGGVPRQMILVGICEKWAAKDDAALLRPPGIPRHARVQDPRGSALVGRCELMGWLAKKPVQFILTATA
jgi:hypothetical protein